MTTNGHHHHRHRETPPPNHLQHQNEQARDTSASRDRGMLLFTIRIFGQHCVISTEYYPLARKNGVFFFFWGGCYLGMAFESQTKVFTLSSRFFNEYPPSRHFTEKGPTDVQVVDVSCAVCNFFQFEFFFLIIWTMILKHNDSNVRYVFFFNFFFFFELY